MHAQSCVTLRDPMDCSMQDSLFFTISWSLLRFVSIESVTRSNHLIFCHLLLQSFPTSGAFPLTLNTMLSTLSAAIY